VWDKKGAEMENRQVPPPPGMGGTPLFKRKRFLFAGAVVVIAIGFLSYIGVSQFATYYVTVSEFTEQADSLADERVRVAGRVASDSVNWDVESFTLSFTLVDGQASMPVVYHGAVPDTFKADNDIVVEGKSDSQGVFRADKLVTKCPSKYEPAD
jgi:cytochrome c-type biogenesis protein CcmE